MQILLNDKCVFQRYCLMIRVSIPPVRFFMFVSFHQKYFAVQKLTKSLGLITANNTLGTVQNRASVFNSGI